VNVHCADQERIVSPVSWSPWVLGFEIEYRQARVDLSSQNTSGCGISPLRAVDAGQLGVWHQILAFVDFCDSVGRRYCFSLDAEGDINHNGHSR
jgi:hypothetical protein